MYRRSSVWLSAGLFLSVLLAGFAHAQTASCFSFPREPYQVVTCCQFWQGCFKGCAQTVEHHTAEDVTAAQGEPIRAAADGVLRHAKVRTAFGGVVILEHQLSSGEIVTTLYGHLDPNTLPLTTLGVRVNRGDVIGYIGSSTVNGGYTPHLHFGINKGAFAEGQNACGTTGSWRYSGYTSCDAEQTRWYVPTDFINARRCTAVACDADRVSNTPSGVTAPMISNDPLEGECITPAGDLDWFLFYGETGQTVTLRAYPAPGTAWPVQMGLKRWAGSDAQTDVTNETATDYSIANEARIMNHTLAGTGRFYVKVRGNGAATGPYVFEKQNVFRDVGDSASPLTVGLPYVRTEFIERGLEEDWYQFTVPVARRIRIEITNENARTFSEVGRPLQMQSALYQYGTRIIGGTESGGNTVIDTQVAAGTYQLKVRAFDIQTGYYRVNILTP